MLKSYAKAIQSYEKITEVTEGEMAAEARCRIGECYYAMGERDKAVEELLRVDILYDDFPRWVATARFLLGQCYEANGAPEKAILSYERLLKENRDSDWAPKAKERLKNLGVAAAG
ncbi:MAG: hypothetical protein CO095_18535 [Armatimonadetes bacterium CG_4_9_14_3_um_filter_58_7]|nr:MAG: hypothetical protein CO095_18535 [Armatimonadetes bacterium CG_4_9_14_3_um_filter_58_7]